MNEDKKINKGFTLIELLITIVIIGLVFTIGYIAVLSIINSSKETKKEINKKFILNASEQYAMEFKDKNSFAKYTNDVGETSFCISLGTLLKYGIYNDNEVLKEYLPNYVVYVSGKYEVYNYELIDLDSANNKCEGVKFISEIKEGSEPNKIISVSEKDINNEDFGLIDITYDFDIIDTGKSNKKYVLSMDLKKHINTKIENITLPVYVALVLDKSGSMAGNKYLKSKEASINLSNQLINKFKDNAYIGLVQFDYIPIIKRNFKSKSLVDDDFEISIYTTNVSGGLDLAIKLFNELKNKPSINYDEALKYTILLYDGIPNVTMTLGGIDNSDSTYYDKLFSNSSNSHKNCDSASCLTYVRNSSNYLQNTMGSKLITIGFEFSGGDDLKKISSADSTLCSDSNLNGYCYYESTSSDINTLFDKIQNNISEEVNKTKASKAKIIIKLNSNITTEINDENKNIIEYEIEFGEKESQENYRYNLIINDSIFEGCTSKESCNKEVKLFDNIIIETYNKDGSLLNTTTFDDSPRFIINNSKYSTLQ